MDSIQLALVDSGGSTHHKILGVLVHGEGNDFPNGLFTCEEHDQTVNTGSCTCMRGSTIGKGVVHGRELGLDVFFTQAHHLEGLHHDLRIVVPDCTGSRLIAVTYQVILVGVDIQQLFGIALCLFQSLQAALRHGEGIVAEFQFAGLFADFVHGEVHDPAKCILLFIEVAGDPSAHQGTDDTCGLLCSSQLACSHADKGTGLQLQLLRKDDIIKLCENHPDCVFLSYTNSDLVDQKFCDEMKRVGNITLTISIEGTKDSNDARRGEGSYDHVMKAMDLLRENGCLFGISVCYTRANVDAVTSDEFVDLMIKKGVRFAWYFNYMPVGKGALPELIPTPEQRTHMYKWLRKMRNSKTGKPMFVIDFQNDAEFVGGCIAGGRNYFHINSAGDIEPCVFIHYSDSNIRQQTLLEALKRPLFQAYYHGQPFNDNHLRPCPMLENPQCLRAMIKKTGAASTDLLAPESVETLCSRCDKFANAWAPVADELWNSTKHPVTKTRYYRDTPEGKAELAKEKEENKD